jgi:hypothetical protein
MKATAICLAICVLTGCAATHPPKDSPRYVHVVILWLKRPGNTEDRQTLIDTSRSFVGKIPGLISVSCGPVHPSTRPVVDSSYDVGLVMLFDSEQALLTYPASPVHQRAVKEVITPLVDHFTVYDFPDTQMTKGRPIDERPSAEVK